MREYKLDSLMKNISMVFQSVYLFNDTVENNIKFGCPDATHEQVVAAAKAACCTILSWPCRMATTRYWERAAVLSPGARNSVSPSPGPCSRTHPS